MKEILDRRYRPEFGLPIAMISAASAIKYSLQYTSLLDIKPNEMKRYLNKSRNLAMCYAGFAQKLMPKEAVGAGKAAFLSCAYDVVSDWKKEGITKVTFEKIVRKKAPPSLADMALEMLDRDLSDNLKEDGLGRGVISTHFILEMMGLKKMFEDKHIDIDRLGTSLQIVDDILDYEDDLIVGDKNCLTSQNRDKYLTQVIEELNEEKVLSMFPYGGVLKVAISKAREKAHNMLSFI